MKSGKALIAAHCENRVGGGLVDFGLFAEGQVDYAGGKGSPHLL